jgi:hypothetical protein
VKTRTDIFDWRFLDDVAKWALGFSIAVAVLGAVITRAWTFPVTCLVVAGVDIALVHAAARRGGHGVETGTVDEVAFLLFGGRFVFKIVALVAAAIAPALISFWGAVAGALIYDTTLAFAGSFMAASRMSTAGR